MLLGVDQVSYRHIIAEDKVWPLHLQLDPKSGIIHKLLAFEELFKQNPELSLAVSCSWSYVLCDDCYQNVLSGNLPSDRCRNSSFELNKQDSWGSSAFYCHTNQLSCPQIVRTCRSRRYNTVRETSRLFTFPWMLSTFQVYAKLRVLGCFDLQLLPSCWRFDFNSYTRYSFSS